MGRHCVVVDAAVGLTWDRRELSHQQRARREAVDSPVDRRLLVKRRLAYSRSDAR